MTANDEKLFIQAQRMLAHAKAISCAVSVMTDAQGSWFGVDKNGVRCTDLFELCETCDQIGAHEDECPEGFHPLTPVPADLSAVTPEPKWDRSGLKESVQRGLAIGRTRQEFDLQLLLDMLLEIERLEAADSPTPAPHPQLCPSCGGLWRHNRGCIDSSPTPRTYHCSCGAACNADEYIEHLGKGHDQPTPTDSEEVQRLYQAIGWICDAADAAYNEDSNNERIHEIFNIAAKAAGLTRRLPDENGTFEL